MTNLLSRFAKDESGATAIEYGLIAGFVSIAIIVALPTISTELKRIFGLVSTKLSEAK
ncbi:MAG: Flp family type IVb pilin [Hyphomicrobiaceae bacterium]|nr:Flp family type IVb pilin [Hyphomicrobiaceae bacterium]